ncbi:MAG: hypothetical protein ABI790_06020 [Betaproteobacteria bacterium]
MKFSLAPLLAAMLCSGSCSVSHAAAVAMDAAPAPDSRSEFRSVIIDSDVTIDNGQGAADLVIAQGTPGSQKKELKIITSGRQFDFADMPDVNMIVSTAMSEAFAGSAAMPMARNVKNAPYSAEVISEKVQALPDGNQISRRTASMAYRDSAGRTRQETRDSKGDVKSVHIQDAVEGTRYVLSPAKKSATRLALDKDLHKRIEEIKEKAKSMVKDGKVQIIERGQPGEEIIVKRIESPAADGKKEVREEVKVQVLRANTGSGQAGTHAFHFSDGESIGHAISETVRNGPIGMSFQDLKWSAKSVTTQLGSKDFEGVRADGKSTSYTIPAGEIGNKNPIVVSTETWTSPDLQVVVYSRHSDPRLGESIYRLANVKRSEPPASLFMVPDGYSVKEMPGIAFGSKSK